MGCTLLLTCSASAMEPSRMPKKMMPSIMQAMAICTRAFLSLLSDERGQILPLN